MEAANSSETSVNLNQTTRSNNPEDSHLQTRRHENLKSLYFVSFDFLTPWNCDCAKTNLVFGSGVLCSQLGKRLGNFRIY
jgi:hypothetical protein